jgi:uncharacterized protein YkwD
MRFFFSILLLAAAFTGLRAQNHDATPGATASGPDFCAGVEKETFQLVNQYRVEHLLPPLTWSDSIAKVARNHSNDMATGACDFGHDGFRDRVNHLSKVMSGFNGAGENVLMTSQLTGTAQSALALWLKSPHHLANIRGDYNYSGMGVWQGKDGALYFTQIFMKFAPVTEEAQAAPEPGLMTPFGMLATPNTRARP